MRRSSDQLTGGNNSISGDTVIVVIFLWAILATTVSHLKSPRHAHTIQAISFHFHSLLVTENMAKSETREVKLSHQKNEENGAKCAQVQTF